MALRRLQVVTATTSGRSGVRGRNVQVARWRNRIQAWRSRLVQSRAPMPRRRPALASRSTPAEQALGGILLGSGMVLMAAWFTVANHQRLGAVLSGFYRTLFT